MNKKTLIPCICYTAAIPVIALLLACFSLTPLRDVLTQLFLVLPVIPVTIMWLWVQRNKIMTFETAYICLILPALFCVLLPVSAGLINGFPVSYSGSTCDQIVSLLSQNAIAAIYMAVLTAAVKWLCNR